MLRSSAVKLDELATTSPAPASLSLSETLLLSESLAIISKLAAVLILLLIFTSLPAWRFRFPLPVTVMAELIVISVLAWRVISTPLFRNSSNSVLLITISSLEKSVYEVAPRIIVSDHMDISPVSAPASLAPSPRALPATIKVPVSSRAI